MNPGTVHLVDDDSELLKSLSRLLRVNGFEVRTHGSAADFLRSELSDDPVCLVLDVSMPGMNGLDLHARLARDDRALPVIFLTGHGDIPMSVRAIKSGAVDFLTKPVDQADLLRAVTDAIELSRRSCAQRAERAELERRFAALTPREREVFAHVISGRLNKQIAAALGTSEQTVKVHRMRITAKLGLNSAVELARAAQQLGVPPAAA